MIATQESARLAATKTGAGIPSTCADSTTARDQKRAANLARQEQRGVFRQQRILFGKHLLFRFDERNWCIGNAGASGEPEGNPLGYYPRIEGALRGLLRLRVKGEPFETAQQLIAVVEKAAADICEAVKEAAFLRCAADLRRENRPDERVLVPGQPPHRCASKTHQPEGRP